MVDEVVGRYLASKREGQYRVLEGELRHRGTTAWACAGTTPSCSPKLDKTLASMKEDGTAGRIATQWFGANIIK